MKKIREESIEKIVELSEAAEQNIHKIEIHKGEAREALKNDQKNWFEFNMNLIRQFKEGYDYVFNRMKFYESCANWDIANCLKYNELCLEYEYKTMEISMDSEMNVVCVDYEGKKTNAGESATLRICDVMKNNKEHRDIYLEVMEQFEKYKDIFLTQEWKDKLEEISFEVSVE